MTNMHVLRTLSAYPREAFGVAMLVVAAFFAVLGLALTPSPPLSGPARASTPSLRFALPAGPPPAPEPLQFKDVTPDDALTLNAVMPFSALPNPKARPLAAKFADPADEARALDCLTAAVYYEAAVEGDDGQRAVAQVVLNRLRHPAYPKTICGVVFQGSERSTGCQFTFTCDGALGRAPIPSLWKRSREIAWAAISGGVFAPVGWATHYHTDWVVPYWASSLAKAQKVGTHIFYRWMGGWGRPPAFRGRYAGVEPVVGGLAMLSLAHAPVDALAAAANLALDQAVGADDLAVATALSDPAAVKLAAGAASPPVAAATAVAKAQAAAAVVPIELRWSLTGTGSKPSEAALGKLKPAASAGKDCAAPSKTTMVAVPGGKGNGAAIKVRERCAA